MAEATNTAQNKPAAPAQAPAQAQQEAQKADAQAHAADQRAIDAQAKADEAAKTGEQRAADKAKADADDAHAKAEEAKASQAARQPARATTAAEAKAASAVYDPDRPIGDHHVQKFANTPANPALAPGLDPDAEGKVRITLTDSDHPDPSNPKVAYVHPEMVGDYLRAGWSRG